MASVKDIEIEINIIFSLNKEEIEWLKYLTQNPIYPNTNEDEDDSEEGKRKKIWKMCDDALYQLDQKKHCI